MKILLIEDDAETAGYLVRALKESGHVIDHSGDGEEGLEMAQAGSFDVLVVDRMIPRRDGLSVIAELRKAGDQTPVLILSALGEVDDRVKGLRAGGDDYLTKPYAFSELLARIEVLAGSIYKSVTQTLDWNFAAAQSVILFAGIALLLIPYLRLGSRARG